MKIRFRIVSNWERFKKKCQKHDWIPAALVVGSLFMLIIILIFVFVVPFYFPLGR